MKDRDIPSTVPLLSALENGNAAPTGKEARRVTRVLDVPVSSLGSGPEPEMPASNRDAFEVWDELITRVAWVACPPKATETPLGGPEQRLRDQSDETLSMTAWNARDALWELQMRIWQRPDCVVRIYSVIKDLGLAIEHVLALCRQAAVSHVQESRDVGFVLGAAVCAEVPSLSDYPDQIDVAELRRIAGRAAEPTREVATMLLEDLDDPSMDAVGDANPQADASPPKR